VGIPWNIAVRSPQRGHGEYRRTGWTRTEDAVAGMSEHKVAWSFRGSEVVVAAERLGRGPTVLLLPALSSISTKDELRPLQELLSGRFETLAIDWPGFGVLDRPFIQWSPAIYREFVDFLLDQVVVRPWAIIAAGHAAGYVVDHAAKKGAASHLLILLSPTWRGPLPTMMGGDRPIFEKLANAVDPPVVGPVVYRLNVNRWVVGMMSRGHVYSDPRWLTPSRLHDKLRVTGARGARHASVRFVAGQLDPFRSRTELLQAVAAIDVPLLNVFSLHAPRKSRLEMEAIASQPNVTTVRVPDGKLSFYEEHPEAAAGAVLDFLVQNGAAAAVTTPEPAG